MANVPTLYTTDGRIFVGMDQPTVQALLNELGSTGAFIDEVTFNALFPKKAHTPPVPPDLTQSKLKLKDKTATPNDRIDALIQILGL